MGELTEVWPVLIVNGRVLVAPDFLVDRTIKDPSITGILKQAINPGIPPVKDTIIDRTFHVSKVGLLTAYFRSSVITGNLVNRPSTEVLYDQASRPQRMIEGFIARDAVDGDIDPGLIDNLRPVSRGALEQYINDTSSWPATEQSRAIRIADIVAPEAEVTSHIITEPEVVAVPAPTPLDSTADDDHHVETKPAPVELRPGPQQPGHPSVWPATHIIAILVLIGAVAGVIALEVITKLLH